MGRFGHRRSVRTWLALTATAAAAASGLAVLGGISVANAQTSDFTFTNGIPIPVEGTVSEPFNVGSGQVVGHFMDTGAGASCNTERFTAKIDWGDGTTDNGTVTCLPVILSPAVTTSTSVPAGPEYTVTGPFHEYVDSGTYNISLTVTDTTDQMSATAKTDTATIGDVQLGFDFDNTGSCTLQSGGDAPTLCTGVEGTGLAINVYFSDGNVAFPNPSNWFDPGISATVDWGDGSAAQSVPPTVPLASCNCSDFLVAATHVYDAASSNYTIKVTAKDDGGQTATDTLAASISDAALTAGSDKSLTATAGTISNQTVGSFTDAAGAQASASDFSAMITWGDGASSVGTVTQSAAGAFNVSGAHGYSTSGSKSITAVVIDQEGQSVTLHATVTVAAAPTAAVLPATGQPQQPSSPLPLALLVLAVMAALGAGGTLLLRRATR